MNQTENGIILFVHGFEDEALERCRAALESRGQMTERVEDVFAAMARLGEAPPVSRVVVDVRYLDATEMAFVDLAPRYFQQVEVVISSLEGLGDRTDISAPGVRCLSPAELIGAPVDMTPPVVRARQADWPDPGGTTMPADAAEDTTLEYGVPLTPEELEALSAQDRGNGEDLDARDLTEDAPPGSAEPPRSMPVLPDRPLSTDGGPRRDTDEESIHDAVRRRMLGDEPRNVRRRPPKSDPTESEDPPPQFNDDLPAGDLSDDELTDEEMESLLGEDSTIDLSDQPETDEGER